MDSAAGHGRGIKSLGRVTHPVAPPSAPDLLLGPTASGDSARHRGQDSRWTALPLSQNHPSPLSESRSPKSPAGQRGASPPKRVCKESSDSSLTSHKSSLVVKHQSLRANPRRESKEGYMKAPYKGLSLEQGCAGCWNRAPLHGEAPSPLPSAESLLPSACRR